MSGCRNGMGSWSASRGVLGDGCLTFQLPINVAHRMQINYEVIKPKAITLSTKQTTDCNGNPKRNPKRTANRKPKTVNSEPSRKRKPLWGCDPWFWPRLRWLPRPLGSNALHRLRFVNEEFRTPNRNRFFGGFVYVANKQSTKSQRWQGVACYAASGSLWSSVVCSISCSHPHVRQPSTELHSKKCSLSRSMKAIEKDVPENVFIS